MELIDDLDGVDFGRNVAVLELGPHVRRDSEGNEDAGDKENGEDEREYSVTLGKGNGSHWRRRRVRAELGVGRSLVEESLSLPKRSCGHGNGIRDHSWIQRSKKINK